MTDRAITLRSDLVERFEELAREQGRSADDLFGEMIERFPRAKNPKNNWLLEAAEEMEAADINWIDDPDASLHSHERFEQYLSELAQRKHDSDTD